MPAANGEHSEIPAHLNRWNWGAFLLNWIWGIGNSVWIALLCLIPGVNIVMMFVLGFKGSRWAWEKAFWRDEDHFRRVQRNWGIAGLIVWLAIPLLIGGISFGVFAALKNSEPYQMTLAEIDKDATVRMELGTDIEPGFFTSGSLRVNGGQGQAILTVPLSGSKGSGKAYTRAVKQAGVWEIVLLVVRVEGSKDPIVLINRDNIPIPGAPLDA